MRIFLFLIILFFVASGFSKTEVTQEQKDYFLYLQEYLTLNLQKTALENPTSLQSKIKKKASHRFISRIDGGKINKLKPINLKLIERHKQIIDDILQKSKELDEKIQAAELLKAIQTHRHKGCKANHTNLDEFQHALHEVQVSVSDKQREYLLKLTGCTKNSCIKILNCCEFAPNDHLPLLHDIRNTSANINKSAERFEGVFEPNIINQIKLNYNIDTQSIIMDNVGCRSINLGGIKGYGGVWTPDRCGTK